MNLFKLYFSLAKPGIVFGNLIAAAAGFFLASQGNVDWTLFTATMLGVVLIVASGCAFNNCVDRDIDGKMQRTKTRVLVTGALSVREAMWFGVISGFIGFALLYTQTNIQALVAGIVGFAVYVGLYTLLYKRTSVHATAIGSLSGACPPVIGYLAVTGNFDIGAAILLLTFCIWQIPHSYAIAIYRFKDYQAAGIPVLPLKDGIAKARKHMIIYIIAFIAGCLMLTQQQYAGPVFATAMVVLGLYWTHMAVVGLNKTTPETWGRKMFILSVITICCFSALLSFDFVVATPLHH